MADEEVLSQDEVDALVNGVKDGAVDTDVAPDNDDYKPLDFANQARIVRSQFPVLARIHERFSKKLSSSIYNLLSREPEIEAVDPEVIKFGELIATQALPTALNVFRFHPLRGKAIFVLDSKLVFTLVENYFGGDGRYQSEIEEREFTMTEQRIIRVVLDMVYSNLTEAWKPIMPVEIESIGDEMNPQLLNAASPEDMMVISKFIVRFDEIEGNLYIVIPYGMLEPIREQLDLGAARTDDEIDPNWVRSLREEVLDAPLEISSTLAETEVDLREVMNMKAGDIIPIELPEVVTVSVGGIPSFRAKYGMSRDKCALKILHRIQR